MSPDDEFQAAYELFQVVCDLAPTEQARVLERDCRERPALLKRVRDLLEADALGTAHLDGPPIPASVREATPETASMPERIGEFRPTAELGRGGMGVVYEAEQDRPRRTVALKLIRPDRVSKEHLRRFQHEAEVLGWLNHPGIAQIYAAGTDDTVFGMQPYLAMELVRGERIDLFATKNGLDSKARLELLALVADAVHHAHQKGVIHRDLKPANVLVDASGQPKVLDFGVARVTNHDLAASVTLLATGEGALLGTLAYMSPEQVAADPSAIDTRSDVYALGVLAYELLSGQRPHELSGLALPEAARKIAEDEPTNLGSLNQRLSGDIATIVSKAMSKEKEQRYASAEEFARDVRRFLSDEPILARPPSTRYQVSKFVRRRKALVASVTALLLALLVGTTLSTVLYLRGENRLTEIKSARESEALARTSERHQLRAALANLERAQDAEAQSKLEAETASEVASFLEQLFLEASPDRTVGADRSARDLLFIGADTIKQTLEQRPELRMRLTWIIGRVLYRLGLFSDAEPLVVESLSLARELDQPKLVAEVAAVRALLHSSEGQYDRALPLEDEVVAFHRNNESATQLELSAALNNRAVTHAAMGRSEEALRDAREATKLAQSDPETLARAELGMANVLIGTGAAEEAVRHIDNATELFGDTIPPNATPRLRAAMLSSHCLLLLGKPAEAAAKAEDSLQRCRATLPPDSELTHTTLDVLASAYLQLGQLDQVEVLYAHLLERPRDDEQYRRRELRSLRNLAQSYSQRGRFDDAIDLLSRLCLESKRSHGEASPMTALLYNNYTEALAAVGKFEQALPFAHAAYAVYADGRKGVQEIHIVVRISLLQCLLETHGDADEMDRLSDELSEVATRDMAADHPSLPYSLLWCVRAQRELEHLDKWLAALQTVDATLNDQTDPSGDNRRAMIGYYRERYVETDDVDAFGAVQARLLKSLGE